MIIYELVYKNNISICAATTIVYKNNISICAALL